ncbi:MAG: hypothetical protein WCA35_06390 [Kovacikia sp.]
MSAKIASTPEVSLPIIMSSGFESTAQALLTQLAQATAELGRSSNYQNEKLDILTDQVGRFTEGLTELKLMIREQSEMVKQQAESTKQQAESMKQLTESTKQQAETVKQQAESIRQQSDTARQQADAARIQAENFSRMIGLLEKR